MSSKTAICIPTYSRPTELARLLLVLEDLENVSDYCEKIGIFVIDNSEEETAREVCSHYQGRLELNYITEKVRGLSSVRNRAITAVVDAYDFIAFLDDDEIPDRCWLKELLDKQRHTSADCVFGPVLPVIPVHAPEWIQGGRFFHPPPFRENVPALCAGTGNLMVSCAFLKRTGLRFDVRLNLTGGEDSYFLRTGYRCYGMKIVGAANATVREHVVSARLNLFWLMRRQFRIGNGLAIYEKLDNAPVAIYFIRALKGLARFTMGLSLGAIGLLFGKHITAKGLLMICLGLGMWAGLLGFIYEEYAPKRTLLT